MPPSPSGSSRYSQRLSPSDIINSNTSLLRYINSHTLNTSSSADDPRFNLPFVDFRTGVRVSDTPWTRTASKTEAIVLNRGPVPVPAWSYGLARDNLSWTDDLSELEEKYPEPLSHLFAEQKLRLSRLSSDTHLVDSMPQTILLAAMHTTLSVFLPSVLATLNDLRAHRGYLPVLERRPIVWHSSWYIDPICFRNPTQLSQASTSPTDVLSYFLIRADEARDPRNAYYNSQGTSACFFATEQG
ncbi:hypothetical protein EWM64_g2850 [Hericium alpestre]|uniref:Uncharacterized protein n=1 Tax=Hericium alpestre TaxID=135208 RepID=A0A4Z0A673_9AGAM|nr:hypothetical protein EWM64_g2850 [Hericium alpestre]